MTSPVTRGGRHLAIAVRHGVAFCLPFLGLLGWAMAQAIRHGHGDDAMLMCLMLLPLAALVAIGAWWGVHAAGKRWGGLSLAAMVQGLLVTLAVLAAGELILFLDGEGWAPIEGNDFWQIPILWAFLALICLALGLVIRRRVRIVESASSALS